MIGVDENGVGGGRVDGDRAGWVVVICWVVL